MKNMIALIIIAVLATGCAQTMTHEEIAEDMMGDGMMDEEMTEEMMEEISEEKIGMIQEMIEEIGADNWRNIEFTEVMTREKFKISDFAGKPVLLESFAVWCPTCKRQQDEIMELHEELGDSIVSVSLDTDPNEDAAKVKMHAARYAYNWRFAISPAEATKSMIDEFGINIVNAPGAPVVLICADQTARLLGRGVKSADDLKKEISKGC